MLEVLCFLLVLFCNVILFAVHAILSIIVVGAFAAVLTCTVIFADMSIDKHFRKQVATKVLAVFHQR